MMSLILGDAKFIRADGGTYTECCCEQWGLVYCLWQLIETTCQLCSFVLLTACALYIP